MPIAIRGRGGVTATEVLLALPALVMLVLGLVEVVALARDSHALNQAALAALRALEAGADTARADAIIDTSTTHLHPREILRSYEHRPSDAPARGWRTLDSTPGVITAAPGDEVRVRLRYPHRLVTGRLFTGLMPRARGGTLLVEASLTGQRR